MSEFLNDMVALVINFGTVQFMPFLGWLSQRVLFILAQLDVEDVVSGGGRIQVPQVDQAVTGELIRAQDCPQQLTGIVEGPGGHREVVFAQALDVAWGIVVLRAGLLRGIHEVEQAVKTDGRPPKGSKIVSSPHSQILH